jgi:hypothetical protein
MVWLEDRAARYAVARREQYKKRKHLDGWEAKMGRWEEE